MSPLSFVQLRRPTGFNAKCDITSSRNPPPITTIAFTQSVESQSHVVVGVASRPVGGDTQKAMKSQWRHPRCLPPHPLPLPPSDNGRPPCRNRGDAGECNRFAWIMLQLQPRNGSPKSRVELPRYYEHPVITHYN